MGLKQECTIKYVHLNANKTSKASVVCQLSNFELRVNISHYLP